MKEKNSTFSNLPMRAKGKDRERREENLDRLGEDLKKKTVETSVDLVLTKTKRGRKKKGGAWENSR